MNKEDWAERQQDIAMIEAGGFTHAITFNTYQKVPPAKIARRVKLFVGIMDKKLGDKLDWVHFYEIASGNAHSHSVVKLDDPATELRFKRLSRKLWKQLAGKQAQLYIDTYKDSVATYITKDGLMIAA